MKEIKAYIRNHMVDVVVDALEALPAVPAVVATEVRGFGHTRDGNRTVRIELTKLELDVPDHLVPEVVDCIVHHARTGHRGDGKVFVSDLREAIRISDGARGEEVLAR